MTSIGDKFSLPFLTISTCASAYMLYSLFFMKGGKQFFMRFKLLMLFNTLRLALGFGSICSAYYGDANYGVPLISLLTITEKIAYLGIILIDCEILNLTKPLDLRVTDRAINGIRYLSIVLYLLLTIPDTVAALSIVATGSQVNILPPQIINTLVTVWAAYVFIFDMSQNMYILHLFYNFNKKRENPIVRKKYLYILFLIVSGPCLNLVMLVLVILIIMPFMDGFSLPLMATVSSLTNFHCILSVVIFLNLRELVFLDPKGFTPLKATKLKKKVTKAKGVEKDTAFEEEPKLGIEREFVSDELIKDLETKK